MQTDFPSVSSAMVFLVNRSPDPCLVRSRNAGKGLIALKRFLAEFFPTSVGGGYHKFQGR